jgi:hypothetical protein
MHRRTPINMIAEEIRIQDQRLPVIFISRRAKIAVMN